MGGWRFLLTLALGCGGGVGAADAGGGERDAAASGWSVGVSLPEPMAGNGVAALELEESCILFSAFGLDASLSAGNSRAYLLVEGGDAWRELPSAGGALVEASAVVIARSLYVFATYLLDDGADRRQTIEVFDLDRSDWHGINRPPISVEGALPLAWRDRYIVIVGGRSDAGYVGAVQIYDSEQNRWIAGTAFPGTPVYGHAGAIFEDSLVILDGAADGPEPALVNQAWRGELDPDQPGRIAWTDLGQHLGPARFRAAGGAAPDGTLWFHGGSSTAHESDGTGSVTGAPAAALGTTLIVDPAERSFRMLGEEKEEATMDHRALARCRENLYSVGGMVDGPSATDAVWRYTNAQP